MSEALCSVDYVADSEKMIQEAKAILEAHPEAEENEEG